MCKHIQDPKANVSLHLRNVNCLGPFETHDIGHKQLA